ncbi:striatin interacting protein isoform X2 [Dermatophagoides pteronyssinus]|uniref:striatin interacting protein isoform X2 n=1 Tax=Dermatophagoides pteronyssinus TaxID=6956 RepID=UPI003F66963C
MADNNENFHGSSMSVINDRIVNNVPLFGSSIPGQNHSSNIEFVYTDTDQHLNEIAELYSYGEDVDFLPNRFAFEELMEDYGYPLKWTHMSEDQKHRAIERMAEGIEFTDRTNRIRAIRGLLYLCQGNFGDCLIIDEQPKYARKNIFHLYDYGLFPMFIQLIYYEIEHSMKLNESSQPVTTITLTTNTACHANVALRLLFNIVYLFVQEMSIECSESDTDYHRKLREQFKEELMQPICGEILPISLLDIIVKHCNGQGPPNFQTKKTLLLLWKVLLLTLGGHDELLQLKNHYRKRAGLKPVPDDTLEVTRRMFPTSPPPTASEMVDSQNQRKMNRPFKRQTVVKQSSFGDESYTASTNFNGDESNANGEDDILNDDAFEPPNDNDGNSNDANGNSDQKDPIYDSPATPRPSTQNGGSPRSSSPVPDGLHNNDRRTELNNLRAALMISKGLPWQTKVRQKDIEQFFNQVRQKFLKYNLPDDYTTTAGLPSPILESIEVLRKHLYISLSEMQIKREDEIARYPLTMKELDDESCNSYAEQLYRTMLPNLPQYLIALLKLLLGSVSNLKSKNDTHIVLADIIPPEPPINTTQSIKMKIDVNRHLEIIIKAISGIMILMLKHYKINHIYQFEYICQQLMFANCIPLIIKFLSQEMTEFVQSKNNIPVLDFPACVIGEQPELTSDTIELLSETQPYSWRNMFSSINLLRILNKLTKWKNCRIIMLVLFKSSQPLKRALRVRHSMFQLYVLKLLKIQAKFLGRQWRKSNMKTMSDIYAKVRHRLNDDWAFANDVDTKSIYVQTEEFFLQANINRFHHRRYEKPYPNNINLVIASQQQTSFSQPTSGHFNGGVRLNDYISNGLNGSVTSPSATALLSIAEADLLQPVDNNLLSVLSKEIRLSKEFKKNYEIWLEREVFRYEINWDELLDDPSGASIDKNFLDFITDKSDISTVRPQKQSSEILVTAAKTNE